VGSTPTPGTTRHISYTDPVSTMLAIDGVVWIAGVAIVVVATGLAFLLVPWGDGTDGDLDAEAQARLLLGEDPEAVDEALRRRAEAGRPGATGAPDEEPL
jgi:hypothetical protein